MLCVGEGENALVDLADLICENKDYSNVTNLWIRLPDNTIKKNFMTKPVDINKSPTITDIGLFGEKRFYRPMGGKLRRLCHVKLIEDVHTLVLFVTLHHKIDFTLVEEIFLERKV